MSGAFIALEGIDGCGKSTQVARLAAWARAAGHDPLLVREPGGTTLGERVRTLLLDPATGDIAAAAEALLYAASRAELVNEVIAPAIARGQLVIADRFVGSSLAYQGAGRQLGVERVANANRLALGDLPPPVTVLLRIDPREAERRRAHEDDDRLEAEGRAFFERVADAYDELAKRDQVHWIVVDATLDEDAVFAALLAGLQPRLAGKAIGASR